MSLNKKPKTIDPNQVDPGVYYYDEVYDDMKDVETETQKSLKETKQGSKYIEGLKQTAELRKAEKELRKFKRYATDREKAEADGDLSGCDVFITSAYKKRLEEVKKLEEEKKRQLALEKDKSMNFLKTQPKAVIEPTRPEPSDCDPPETLNQVSTLTEVPPVEEQIEESTSRPDKRKRPRTIDERREYLRQILAKRTVGKVFDQAVERYHRRKALMQENLTELLQQ